LAEVLARAPQLLEQLDTESARHFEALQKALRDAGVAYTINPRLVRGLDYYNATVFEWTTDRLGAQGTVCAGGRYDGLLEQLGGKPAPGCGFAMGVERLLALIRDASSVSVAAGLDGYLLWQGDAGARAAALQAEKLRDLGVAVALHCGIGSLKSQMKKADESGARFALILGPMEQERGLISVKPLRGGGEQVMVSAEAAADLLRA
jgi:histidyl-tRNA synthetase